MKSKPISASTKKSIIITQKSNISKKPTIVKCFICNQMFYTQQTFDIHMDQHQKKVNKNLPDQIQRKTMQSFGIKRKQSINRKNTTLQAINQNQISQKISLSSTMKNPLIKNQFADKTISSKLKQTTSIMSKKSYSKVLQTQKYMQDKKQLKQEVVNNTKKQADDRQIQQIDEAIRQSTMIMSQIAFITQRIDYSEQINLLAQNQSESQQQEEIIQKNISEQDFIQMIRHQNSSILKIQEDILKVNFTNKTLQNCQIQIQYLRNLKRLSTDPKSLQKINKIKSKVLNQVIFVIMQNSQTQKLIKKQQKSSNQKKKIEKIQNLDARNCSECFDSIGYGQKCIIFDDQPYHQNCFNQISQ